MLFKLGAKDDVYTESLKVAAANFGLDPTWILKILAEFGSEALPIIVEAMRNGFSKETVIELIEKLGPQVLQLVVNVINQWHMMNPAGTMLSKLSHEDILVIKDSIRQVIIDKWLFQE